MKKKQKRTLWGIIIALVVIVGGYFSFVRPHQQANKTVTVGIMSGTQKDDQLWDNVAKTAKDKYGITLKFKKFTDYNQPNKALSNGDVDINSFQHKLFLKQWNEAHHTNLVSLGDTWIAPIRVYSNQYKSLNDLPNGATIAVPNDATNESRALFALKNAGVFNIKKGTKLATIKDITDNKKNVKIKELSAEQVARSLKDVDAAVINTNYASAAGIDYKSAIFVEPTNQDSKQWVNVIAVDKKNANKQVLKDVVKAYQTESNKQLMKKLYGEAQVPAWDLKF